MMFNFLPLAQKPVDWLGRDPNVLAEYPGEEVQVDPH